MLQAFKDYIHSTKLFQQTDRILLAVSGGVDSVAMVRLCKDAAIDFGIAHVNFMLRGSDSEKDEAFVKSIAEQNQVVFHVAHFDTTKYAASHKISTQMAARDLRYEWFDQILIEFNYDFIATAHHLDDQTETFFINIMRGAGISGMHGILPKQGKIIRPLMYATRDQIMEYALKNEISWRDDKSNKSRKYLRNRIRHEVVAELNKICPQFSQKLNESICHLRDVETIFDNHIIGVTADLVQQKPEGTYISIDWIYEYEPHETYLFELLKPYGFTFPVVKEIARSLDTFSGKVFYSHTHRLLRDRENFIIQPLSELNALADNHFKIEKGVSQIEEPISLQAYETELLYNLPMGKVSFACLDADRLVFPLRIRKWEKGDWFMPLGLKGKKKLSDFFVDQKVSVADKEKVWLLISGEDIVWVIGKRIDNRYRITPKTKKAFVICCAEERPDESSASSGCSLLFG